MKESKRLLRRNNEGLVEYTYDGYFDEKAEKAEDAKVFEKLCDLEDKIENGTLIELPCKIGDTVYFVNKYRPMPRIEKFSVSYFEVTAYERPIVIVCANNDCAREHARYSFQFPDKNVFFTESEAEARLQKLLKENPQK